ncbi:hypothetical protein CYMTET_7859 [Cymbomonas tetramitiformis]|uniref:UDP-galactose transporter n=1 Tax=Cymbomonas tetramitiformis TaxID=36881 RepID=A0AAE0LGF7_9CHLO|nr:hypothetical protein CYMTET_7859 [Cymbomonas tetramitiformis]
MVIDVFDFSQALVFSLSILITSGGLCVASATRHSEGKFSSSSLVFCTNVLKTFANLSVFAYVKSAELFSFDKELSPSGAFNWRYAIPGVLYTLSDNIAFTVLGKINPAIFSIIWNTKTAMVAVFMRLFLIRKPFSYLKWLGIALLLLGPAIIEFGGKDGEGDEPEGDEPEGEAKEAAPIHWHFICLCGAAVSASSNVYTEYLLKTYSTDNILWQNTQLYFVSLIGSWIAMASQEGLFHVFNLLDPEYLFNTFNGFAFAAMIFQSSQAFVVPYILKYIDNIADLYAHAGSVLLTTIVSWMFFNLQLTWYFTLGLTLSLMSLVLYYAERLFPDSLNAGEDAEDPKSPYQHRSPPDSPS